MVAALDAWVTQHKAPTDLDRARIWIESKKADRTRPLCPFPQEARYKGTGDSNDAANFACAVPADRQSLRRTETPSCGDSVMRYLRTFVCRSLALLPALAASSQAGQDRSGRCRKLCRAGRQDHRARHRDPKRRIPGRRRHGRHHQSQRALSAGSSASPRRPPIPISALKSGCRPPPAGTANSAAKVRAAAPARSRPARCARRC